MQRDVAADLFRRVGLDFDAEKKRRSRRRSKPVPLGNATLGRELHRETGTKSSRKRRRPAGGTSHPDETIVYTAHWDHLGIGLPDATGDRISQRGARQRASASRRCWKARSRLCGRASHEPFCRVPVCHRGREGTAGLATRSIRSIRPCHHRGRLQHRRREHGAVWDVAVAGDGKISLQDDLPQEAARARAAISRPIRGPKPARSSDRITSVSAKVGVPAISFRAGLDRVEGGVAAGKALADEHNAKHYHQPSDGFSEDWDWRGEVIDVGLPIPSDARWRVRAWPAWKEGSSSKPSRDKTSSSRQ